jgi:hypothetical protein
MKAAGAIATSAWQAVNKRRNWPTYARWLPTWSEAGSGTGTNPAYWQAKKNRMKSGFVSATKATRVPRSRPRPCSCRASRWACSRTWA